MAVADIAGPIVAFLDVPTPAAWVEAARERLPLLLLDHANCELKAASTALAFIYRYPERTDLCLRMSKLAREELRHYEQVRGVMRQRAIPFERLSASRYAGALRDQVRAEEPDRLLDMLLVGALIEARSCERFAALAPHLPDDLAAFYRGLLASEARHFDNYLTLAQRETGFSRETVDARLVALKSAESTLVTAPDPDFRFHSGPPPRA